MVLYIDETEHEKFFIVSGLLVQSEKDVQREYRRFKKKISCYPLSNKLKQKVFLEFKATLLDKNFQRIKSDLLQSLNAMNGQIIYSVYEKKIKQLKQKQKEAVYISLISKIVNSVNEPVEVVFDRFNNKEFESLIKKSILEYENVASVNAQDSQCNPGLQFVDNACSVIRLYKSNNDKDGYYTIIQNMVNEI